ncbi:DUF2752 domain-containing protein [uncultured Friedmanniella sp.]|uniref:DUF2752 domain-containing protein n=1 Tax=uncultured Friedmanniella sp. TaxID=335381 RepID=UPI0035C98ADD
MDSAAQPHRPFQAGRGLVYLGGFFGYGLAVSAVYATTGVGLPCPFRALTGWQCPLCGGTRLGRALLEGNVGAAFADNPVVFVGLAVLSVLGILWTVEVLGGPAVRLPRAWAARVQAVHPTRWLVVALGLAVAFVVLRNLF